MNMHTSQFEADYRANMKTIRARLMGKPEKVKRQVLVTKTDTPKDVIKEPGIPGRRADVIITDPNIDPAMTSEALREYPNAALPYGPPEKITDMFAYILKRSEQLGIEYNDIIGENRAQYVVKYKYLLYYELRCAAWDDNRGAPYSYPKISDEFGNADHSSVMAGIRKVQLILDRYGSYAPYADKRHRRLFVLGKNMPYIAEKRYSDATVAKIFGVARLDAVNAIETYFRKVRGY